MFAGKELHQDTRQEIGYPIQKLHQEPVNK